MTRTRLRNEFLKEKRNESRTLHNRKRIVCVNLLRKLKSAFKTPILIMNLKR